MTTIARATCGGSNVELSLECVQTALQIATMVDILTIAEKSAFAGSLAVKLATAGAIYISGGRRAGYLAVESGLTVAAACTRCGTLTLAVNVGVGRATRVALTLASRLARAFAFSLTVGARVVRLTLGLATSGAFRAAIQIAVRRTIQIRVCGTLARTRSVTIGLASWQRGGAIPFARGV